MMAGRATLQMKPQIIPTLTAALLLALPASSLAQRVQLSGMVSLLGSARLESDVDPALTGRFLPEVKVSLGSGHGITIDAEASANAFGTALWPSGEPAQTSGDIKPYRAWLRLSTAHFEARAGLQKVNFGSATLFRPLMWFDSLDPRDPLQLTDGVYALLLRYFTTSNASFSAWTMYGNDARRGWDLAPPDRKTPEFGGRIQIPLFKGELGGAYHHRKASIDGLMAASGAPGPTSIEPVGEDRIGLDGKWDLGVGVWIEGALTHQKTTLLSRPYQLLLNAGVDYTFGVGNGLTAMAEHFRVESRARAFTRGGALSFSALLLRYPLGILDELTGIFYFDWNNRDAYRFITWRRTYDAWSLNVIFFWNPGELPVLAGQPASSSYAGKGFQLLSAYHF